MEISIGILRWKNWTRHPRPQFLLAKITNDFLPSQCQRAHRWTFTLYWAIIKPFTGIGTLFSWNLLWLELTCFFRCSVEASTIYWEEVLRGGRPVLFLTTSVHEAINLLHNRRFRWGYSNLILLFVITKPLPQNSSLRLQSYVLCAQTTSIDIPSVRSIMMSIFINLTLSSRSKTKYSCYDPITKYIVQITMWSM